MTKTAFPVPHFTGLRDGNVPKNHAQLPVKHGEIVHASGGQFLPVAQQAKEFLSEDNQFGQWLHGVSLLHGGFGLCRDAEEEICLAQAEPVECFWIGDFASEPHVTVGRAAPAAE